MNLQTLGTFVVDMGGANIITYYPIDFGLDEIANKSFLEALIGNKERLEEKFTAWKEEIVPELLRLEKENQEHNAEIELLEGQIKVLRCKKETISAKKREYQSELDRNTSQLYNVNEKLIRSAKVIV